MGCFVSQIPLVKLSIAYLIFDKAAFEFFVLKDLMICEHLDLMTKKNTFEFFTGVYKLQ